MSFKMKGICENFGGAGSACLRCTEEKAKNKEYACFKKKEKDYDDAKTTIKCKCGWIGKTEEPIGMLANINLEYLLRQHVAEKHYKEFKVSE